MTVISRPGVFLLLPLLLLGVAAGARQAPTPKADTTTADTVLVGSSAPSDAPVDSNSYLSGASESTENVVSEPVTLRMVPDTAVEAWKKDRHFAYANDPAYWRRQQSAPSPALSWIGRILSSAGFRYFVYFVLGGLLVFAILRIMLENNVGLFYRSRSKKRSGGRDGRDEGGVEAEDLDERLRYYLGQNDHRQAVRYLYLRSLRGLSGRGLIKGGGRSTNREYLLQLAGTPQEAAFRFLTGAYEKVWYGEFDLSNDAFQRLLHYFEDFDKTVAA
jgi:hypothetical protein